MADTNEHTDDGERRGARRDQKVSVDHGTPGGGVGVPDQQELEADPQQIAEKGDTVEQDGDRKKA